MCCVTSAGRAATIQVSRHSVRNPFNPSHEKMWAESGRTPAPQSAQDTTLVSCGWDVQGGTLLFFRTRRDTFPRWRNDGTAHAETSRKGSGIERMPQLVVLRDLWPPKCGRRGNPGLRRQPQEVLANGAPEKPWSELSHPRHGARRFSGRGVAPSKRCLEVDSKATSRRGILVPGIGRPGHTAVRLTIIIIIIIITCIISATVCLKSTALRHTCNSIVCASFESRRLQHLPTAQQLRSLCHLAHPAGGEAVHAPEELPQMVFSKSRIPSAIALLSYSDCRSQDSHAISAHCISICPTRPRGPRCVYAVAGERSKMLKKLGIPHYRSSCTLPHRIPDPLALYIIPRSYVCRTLIPWRVHSCQKELFEMVPQHAVLCRQSL